MNYWFIYSLESGIITNSYLGNAEEWTNVPDGCGVIGPLSSAQDTFINPECYTVVEGQLQPVPNIDQIKEAKAQAQADQEALPSLEQRLQATEDAITALLGI